MEKELLKKLRKEYKTQMDDLTNKKVLLGKLFYQKELIEDNIIIQEYLELNRNIDSLRKDIKSMQNDIKDKTIKLYTEICMNSKDNNLYVYIDDVYDVNENLCSYYYDVISGLPKEIVISEVEEFEKNNNIIDLNSYISNSDAFSNGFDCQGSNLGINDIVKVIQKEFIMDSLDKGQDKAVQRMLIKAKK